MKNGILLIALLMAATAFTSGVPHAGPSRTTPNHTTPTVTLNTTTPHHKTTTVPLKTTTPHHKTTTVPLKTTTPHHKTTTVPLKTTTPHHKTTTVPLKTTTLHHKTTTVPLKTTTPHHKTTTVPLKTTTPHHKTTTAPLKTTTPHHKTTTVPLNTTTPHLKTTTAPLKTTTPHHKTTTAPLKTTTPHHKTTTVPLKTTTPHHKTTTPHTTSPSTGPTSPTNITGGNYTVLDKNNKTCVMADFEIKIFVNNSEVNGTFIVQPIKTNTSGNCTDTVAVLLLQFVEGKIMMTFRNNESSKMVYVETLEYKLDYAFIAGALRKYSGKNETLQLFAAAAGHSYSCKDVKVFMGQGVHLDFTKSRVQAYNIKNKNFGKTDLCKADQPDYRVPIAVAIILILLIVIVVIAYCVSRKRRTNGYQSL